MQKNLIKKLHRKFVDGCDGVRLSYNGTTSARGMRLCLSILEMFQ